MKRVFAALLLAGVLAPAHAQQEPSEVTDNEIAKAKASTEASCQEGGKQQGGPEDKVKAFCTCLMSHLETDMSRVEWQQVYFYALKKQIEDEQRILLPHLKTFRGCAAPDAPQGAAPVPPEPSGTGLRPPGLR